MEGAISVSKKGKYDNYLVLQRDPSLRPALPQTRQFTFGNFAQMVDSYGDVIVKPTFGSRGVGVTKVSQLAGNRYLIHQGVKRVARNGKAGAYAYLKGVIGKKPCIVQRYVHLAQVNNRPIDLRVMVQRRKGGPWKVTGKLAKVAGPNQIITNVHLSKGYVLPAMTALTRNFSRRTASGILAKVDQIGLQAATSMGRAYGYRKIGFDMAVDKNRRVWILEGNSRPDLSLFLKLKDKSQYWTIRRYL